MKSTSTIVMVVVILAIGLGGLYYSLNQQLFEQKKELSDEVGNLKTKVTDLEKNASEANKNARAQTPAAPTGNDAAATTETTPPATSGQTATKAPATSGAQAAQTTTANSKDWKTFSSTTYGYTIKYPTDWDYKDTTATAMSEIGFKPKTQKDSYAIAVTVEKSNLDYSVAVVKKQMSDTTTYKNKTTATLNGQEFTVLNFENKSDSKIKPAVYLVAKDDLVYRFTTGTSSDNNTNSIVSEMINTFQLTK